MMVQRRLEIHLAPKRKKDIVMIFHKEQSSNISIQILLNLRSLRWTCETAGPQITKTYVVGTQKTC